MKKIIFLATALSVMTTQMGCFGSFKLVKKVYEVNQQISNDKIIKTLFFYVLLIIPAYELAALLDVVLFNLIEFWTGSNPISMKEGESEEQLVNHKGKKYKIKASKNQMAFSELKDGEFIALGTLRYDPKCKTWNLIKDGLVSELIKIDGQQVNFNTASGIQQVAINEVDCIALKENYETKSATLALAN